MPGADRERQAPDPHAGNRLKIASDFWDYVQKLPADGCWEWQRSCGSHGYGQFYLVRGKPLAAHRFSWQMTYGPIPAGLHVLHRCDNKRCVRPDHLFLGTARDNIRDCVAKGRHRPHIARGEDSAVARLTDVAVDEIKATLITGTRQHPGNAKQLAAKFGVTVTRIYQVGKRGMWGGRCASR